MSKRANNEGSLYKRRDGRWVAVINLGHTSGRRERLAFYGATQAAVRDLLKAALQAQEKGLPLGSGRQRVSTYVNEWLGTVKSSVRPSTWRRYEETMRIHAMPSIGHLTLAQLGPQHLRALYGNLIEAGLAPASVRHVHAVLHVALRQAERDGIIPRNVAGLVTPPRVAHREMHSLSPEQARTLLEAARGDRLEALYVLATTAGMREGELLALRWKDVDLDGCTVSVRSTLQWTPDGFELAETKTATSRRQVAVTDVAIAALRRHRAAQIQERLKVPGAWRDLDLVFANELGGPLNASNLLRRSFRPLLERAGLPRIRFHDLRHSAATLLLGRGVHPKIVSEMLGHSSIAITLDLYSHVSMAMQGAATRAMDEVLAR